LQNNFKNPQQKKFYFIKRAIMMGNILIVLFGILYFGKEFLGV
tara:strand:+ start:6594 stop:6722 length:129 start_codon:yes stop_codon:yes gene_type:complete